MMKANRSAPLSWAYLGLVEKAAACGTCVMAQAAWVFPPSLLWSGIIPLWYLGQGAIATLTGETFRFQLGFFGGLILLALCFFAGGEFLGPIIFIPFAIGPVGGFARCLMPRRECSISKPARRATLILGSVMLVALSAGAIYAYAESARQDRADFLMKWSGTAIERTMIHSMRNEGSSALPDLRKIIREGDCYIAHHAIKSLAVVTDDREADMELCLKAFRRDSEGVQQGQHSPNAGLLEDALRTISGLDLPAGSSPDEWDQAWKALHDTDSSQQESEK